VAIQCAPLPASVQLALLACPSFDAVQAVLRRAKRGLGEILAAVEFLDDASMHLVTNHLEGVINPLARDGSSGVSPFYMVVETHGSNARHDQEKMEEFLEARL
jgi:D-2-hydroxyglutarate dehydrogenase